MERAGVAIGDLRAGRVAHLLGDARFRCLCHEEDECLDAERQKLARSNGGGRADEKRGEHDGSLLPLARTHGSTKP